MSQATFTFRVDADLKDAFANAAQANDRTSAQLLRDFMRNYVREQASQMPYDEWFRATVNAGFQAYHEGRVISNEESRQRAKARRERILSAVGEREA